MSGQDKFNRKISDLVEAPHIVFQGIHFIRPGLNMRRYVIKDMVAGKEKLFFFFVEADVSLRVSGRQDTAKLVIAHLNDAVMFQKSEFGDSFRAVLEAGMAFGSLNKFFKLKTVM